MDSREQYRKKSLDGMINEKFTEIFFLAKDEFDIESNSPEEQKLYDFLNAFESKLKRKCKKHFEAED
jgi:hypothetical protein